MLSLFHSVNLFHKPNYRGNETAINSHLKIHISNEVKKVQDAGNYPVIWCSEAARALVKSSTQREIPDVVVISVPEVVSEIQVEQLGKIKLED